MPTVDCETSEEYFYDSEQSLASEASEDSFHSANEKFFLPYDVRTDFQEISAYNKLVNKLFKVVFLAMLAGVQNMRKMMLTVITVQAQVAQRADNSTPTDKSLSSYSKN